MPDTTVLPTEPSLEGVISNLDVPLANLRTRAQTPPAPDAEINLVDICKVQSQSQKLGATDCAQLEADSLCFLLDTGADVTILPSWCWRQLICPPLRPSSLRLRTHQDRACLCWRR